MRAAQFIFGPMRVPFLILGPACVLLGVGTAVRTVGHVSAFYVVLAMIGGVAAHISVNAFNEYFDCKSGLDALTERTPFSGGSGTLAEHPDMAHIALATALVSMAATGLIGVYFLFVRGLAIVPLGILGLLVIFAYTPMITRRPFWCLIAPGLGFGTLMVMGTDFVLTGRYSVIAFVASLVPFFLVSDLLLLNQFPDVDPDRTVGRKHLPILLGRRRSSMIYISFLFLAYVSIIFGVLAGYLNKASLLGLATVLLAIPASINAYRYADDIKKLKPFLGVNVIINIATPVLVAVGLLVGR